MVLPGSREQGHPTSLPNGHEPIAEARPAPVSSVPKGRQRIHAAAGRGGAGGRLRRPEGAAGQEHELPAVTWLAFRGEAVREARSARQKAPTPRGANAGERSRTSKGRSPPGP